MSDLTPEPTADAMAVGSAADAASLQLGGGRGSDEPRDGDQIIGMSFDKVSRAEEVLLTLVHLQQEGEIALRDAVIAAKDEHGKVRIHQTIDPTVGQSAGQGAIWGTLIGVLFGPAFFVGTLAGAAGGALMARLIDLGLDDKWVKEVGEWLDPGTSALLLLVSEEVRPAVVRELGRYEGRVLYCTFPDAVREELERALSDER